MRDITSGHLRSSGGTKHLCLGLLGTLWFTRGRLPQVQATLQSVSITLSYFFHLLGLFGPLQPERHHFPSVWGLLSVDSAAGLLRGGISSDQCHCGRPKTVVARHIFQLHTISKQYYKFFLPIKCPKLIISIINAIKIIFLFIDIL